MFDHLNQQSQEELEKQVQELNNIEQLARRVDGIDINNVANNENNNNNNNNDNHQNLQLVLATNTATTATETNNINIPPPSLPTQNVLKEFYLNLPKDKKERKEYLKKFKKSIKQEKAKLKDIKQSIKADKKSYKVEKKCAKKAKYGRRHGFANASISDEDFKNTKMHFKVQRLQKERTMLLTKLHCLDSKLNLFGSIPVNSNNDFSASSHHQQHAYHPRSNHGSH